MKKRNDIHQEEITVPTLNFRKKYNKVDLLSDIYRSWKTNKNKKIQTATSATHWIKSQEFNVSTWISLPRSSTDY